MFPFPAASLAQKEPSESKKPQREFKEGEIIVKYKKSRINLGKSAGRKKAESFENSKKIEKLDEVDDYNMRLVKIQGDVLKTIAELEKNPDVEFASPNFKKYPVAMTVDDTYFDQQWGLAKIQAPEAWDNESAGGGETVVAVIDTGIRYAHEDLSANMWDGSACKDSNGIPVPGGCPNHGWDFKDADSDPDDTSWPDPKDPAKKIDGHGTMVAGVIAAASGNALGVSGLSYRNKVKVMALRFGMDTMSEVKAINFAKHNGARVINASYGGNEEDLAEKAAIDAFPGLFVAAAGNGGADKVGDNNDSSPSYPCNHASSNIVCVAATDQNDALAPFSDYGPTAVDIGAPGVSIGTTLNSSLSSYGNAGGTSLAAPFVAGSAAMFFAAHPSLDAATAKNTLLVSGDPLPSLAGKTVSGKRLNLRKFLAAEPVPPAPAQPAAADSIPILLEISEAVSKASKNSVRITWTTSTPSGGTVSLKVGHKKKMVAALSSADGLVHTATVKKLGKNRTYYYRITSVSADGSQGAEFAAKFKTKKK